MVFLELDNSCGVEIYYFIVAFCYVVYYDLDLEFL